jgi:excisionase family DNA binding protein
MNGDLLTADEVARILRVPKSWVYSHLSEIPIIRLGRYVRFRRSDVVGAQKQTCLRWRLQDRTT